MDNLLHELKNWLILNEISNKENYEIKRYSWLKAGGTAKLYITPENSKKCIELINYLNTKKINFYVFGNQSNIIVRDGIINTPILNLRHLNKLSFEETKEGFEIFCESGVSIPRFAKAFIKRGLSGTEGLLGIPGSIGGGICMNASSYGSEVTNYLKNIIAINEDGIEISISKKDLELSWRSSLIKKRKITVISCLFFINKKNYIGANLTKEKSLEIMNHRKTYQENDLPNLGSIFATKNIYKDLARLNIIFYFVYLVYKLLSIFYHNFRRKKLHQFRTSFIKLYLKMLKLNKFQNFTSSSKTLNCIVNKGSDKSTEAIIFLQDFKKQTKNCLKFENIILDNIK